MTRTDQFSNDCRTAHISSYFISSLYYIIFIQQVGLLIILSQWESPRQVHLPIALGMSSRGYSQVHHSGTARPNGVDGDDGEFVGGGWRWRRWASADQAQACFYIHPRSVTQEYWKRREGVVRRSCISIIIPWRSCASRGSVVQFVGESHDGRAAVPSISREGVTQSRVWHH